MILSLGDTYYYDTLARLFFRAASELEETLSPDPQIAKKYICKLKIQIDEIQRVRVVGVKKKVRIVFDVTAREELEVVEGILVEKIMPTESDEDKDDEEDSD